MRAGMEHADKADAMRSRADNIEKAADHAIYSDDADAIERLRERIAELEAQHDRITTNNKAARAAKKAGRPINADDLAILDDRQRADLLMLARVGMMRPDGTFPSYATANLGGNISKQRERLEGIERHRPDAASDAELRDDGSEANTCDTRSERAQDPPAPTALVPVDVAPRDHTVPNIDQTTWSGVQLRAFA